VVVTVIVALPAATPDTTPAEVTSALLVALDVHDTVLSVALEGDMVGVNVKLSPTPIVLDVWSSDTLVTATGEAPPEAATSPVMVIGRFTTKDLALNVDVGFLNLILIVTVPVNAVPDRLENVKVDEVLSVELTSFEVYVVTPSVRIA